MVLVKTPEITSLKPEQIVNFSDQELLALVLQETNVRFLRQIAFWRFYLEASLKNKSPDRPFIVWPAMNREPKAWLPTLLAKVARTEFQDQLENKRLVVIAVPSSTTWYIDYIGHVFPEVQFPQVLKENQLNGKDVSSSRILQVSSYTQNRYPNTGEAGGTNPMYFFNPEVYQGATLLILDDALAERVTTTTIARFAKSELGVQQVFVAAAMSKEMQVKEILVCPEAADGMTALIYVTGVIPDNQQPIIFHSGIYDIDHHVL